MELFENRRCSFASITVGDNPSKCVFDKLKFAHVKTGQTTEERIAVITWSTPQGISLWGSRHICEILSNPLDIIHSNETRLTMRTSPDTKVLFTATAGCTKLPIF